MSKKPQNRTHLASAHRGAPHGRRARRAGPRQRVRARQARRRHHGHRRGLRLGPHRQHGHDRRRLEVQSQHARRGRQADARRHEHPRRHGRRNERGIYVRGFGRWQVPLSIDGIRIYLPADNRLDFSRFLTQDLAEVDVQKGYVSVLDGPGGMGGAINLVTRKPTETFESEVQARLRRRRTRRLRVARHAARRLLRAGQRELPRPRLLGALRRLRADLDGRRRRRNGSDNEDSRINLKVGFTPNDTDEYSISYTAQDRRERRAAARLQQPAESAEQLLALAVVGHRQPLLALEARSSAPTTSSRSRRKLFFNTFENSLFAYDNATYTTQSLNGRFQSFYDDEGYGGSVEIGTRLGRATRSARRSTIGATSTPSSTTTARRSRTERIEPCRRSDEDTWSFAVENTFAATDKLDLVAGLSYDENDLSWRRNSTRTQGCSSIRPAAATPTTCKARPTGTTRRDRQLRGVHLLAHALPDDLRALQHALRHRDAEPGPRTRAGHELRARLVGASRDGHDLSTALFYADVEDMIQTVVVVPTPAADADAERRRRRVLRRRARRAHAALGRVRHRGELHAPRARDQRSAAAEFRGRRRARRLGVRRVHSTSRRAS